MVLASFGSSQGIRKPVFNVEIVRSADDAKPIIYEKPLRYGKLEEIHHTFRGELESPPKIISLIFVLAIAATVPAIFVGVRISL